MEKVIKIGDKDVRLKANAMQAIIYRREFGRDIMEVQGSIMKMMSRFAARAGGALGRL